MHPPDAVTRQMVPLELPPAEREAYDALHALGAFYHHGLTPPQPRPPPNISSNLSSTNTPWHVFTSAARGLFSLAADGGGGGGGQQRSGSNSTGTYAHIFSILTRLRLLCLHPSLVPPELIEKVRRVVSPVLLTNINPPNTNKTEHHRQVKRLHRTAAAAASGAGGAAAVMDPQAAMAKALGDLGKDGVDKLLKALEAKQGESEDWCVRGRQL